MPGFLTLFVNLFTSQESAGFLNLIFELYLFVEYLPLFWTLFKKPADSWLLWTVFIRWIFVGFLNLIRELYWRIKFTNKVQKTGRFLTLCVNCICSMNICRFLNLIFELAWKTLSTKWISAGVLFLADTVHKYSSQIWFLKLGYSEKATKYEKIFHLKFDVTE